jgi:tetratricopeptide (TPR) repeat protein
VRDEIENALALSGQPVKRGSMAHDHDVYMVLADAAAQSQDADAIKRYAPRLQELATRDGHKLYLAIAHRAHGIAHRLAGEHAKAEARLNQALKIFDELGTRWQIGRTLFALGEMEAARSKKSQARDYFTRALAAFEALEANPDIERTRAALKKLG